MDPGDRGLASLQGLEGQDQDRAETGGSEPDKRPGGGRAIDPLTAPAREERQMARSHGNLTTARRTGHTEGVPDNTARCRASKATGYRRWLRRLTLWQYALFIAVIFLTTGFVTGTLISAYAWPRDHNSWASNLFDAAVLTVTLTSLFTWQRWEDLRHERDSERHEGDGADGDSTAAPPA